MRESVLKNFDTQGGMIVQINNVNNTNITSLVLTLLMAQGFIVRVWTQ